MLAHCANDAAMMRVQLQRFTSSFLSVAAHFHSHNVQPMSYDALRAGSVQWPRCTLAYAPPEVVKGAYANIRIKVATAHDIWALGALLVVSVGCTQSVSALMRSRFCMFARVHVACRWTCFAG